MNELSKVVNAIFAITIPSFYRMDSSIAKFFSGFFVFTRLNLQSGQ